MVEQKFLSGMPNDIAEPVAEKKKSNGAKAKDYEPPNLGKAIRLPVPDFSDANRPPTCLEIDFPIAPINALSNLEGNAGKPIYQMSKWWARRRSSVFRSLLIAAATEAPDDPSQAAKLVWDHYYANHQKAGTFKKLRVLEPFMGGGTTLVEGARLGFQMTGIDLNPVAWFVTKNELACSDPELVKAFFEKIETDVKPLVQSFYATSCPRGHKGQWINNETGKPVDIEPLDLPPEQRKQYRWEGPEVIYTFWAKHGPCQAAGCNHRTPIFRTPIIAEKKLSTNYMETICPSCKESFNIELGETRMAPCVERVVLDMEPAFTETTQTFAQLLKDYDKGNSKDTGKRTYELLEIIDDEPGLRCPGCGAFAGKQIRDVLERHTKAQRAADIKKKHLEIRRRSVQMYLLIHPGWLAGVPGYDEKGKECGGYVGAPVEDTIEWHNRRLEDLAYVEVRGDSLSDEINLTDGTSINTTQGTVPKRSHFSCGSCGRQQDILESVKPTGHTAPVFPYALQCHCPQCEREGFNYGGRYFKVTDSYDVDRLNRAEQEWSNRNEKDLSDYWPREELLPAYMTHKLNGGIPNWGYTHWWKMFNPRQLLAHTQLAKTIGETNGDQWPLDTREQALGAFQQHLRYCSMFSFYQQQYDKTIPHFSNANYHPKMQVSETSPFAKIGAGRWVSCAALSLEGISWQETPWEIAISNEECSSKVFTGESIASHPEIYCTSSAELQFLDNTLFDFVITDPPFGNNLFYADLADFFYVWIRIPLLKWYDGMPEKAYFESVRTPHSVEAIDNSLEHPDDREPWEKDAIVLEKHLHKVRGIIGDSSIEVNDSNPLYRPQPSSDFYRQTLTACWSEANRLLKPGGLMAFTFHHSEDAPWVDVLESLFNAGFILVATYPVRSDESKGENAAFGSRKIEYDIVHVCRKRLEESQAVSWARMRRWVKDETGHLKNLLEHSHGKDLPEPDLRVILRGKALEFYSRHYGQVYTGDGQILSVGEALLGINQLLDDLLAGEGTQADQRPPEGTEPASRLFLGIFKNRNTIGRDELHKTLRGTGIAQANLETRGWIKAIGTTINVLPIVERFQYFTARGRNRKVLKTDMDQAHFLIGACMDGSGIDVNAELDRGTFTVKKSVDAILGWYAEMESKKAVREAAKLAAEIVAHWRTRPKVKPQEQMTLFDLLEAED